MSCPERHEQRQQSGQVGETEMTAKESQPPQGAAGTGTSGHLFLLRVGDSSGSRADHPNLERVKPSFGLGRSLKPSEPQPNTRNEQNFCQVVAPGPDCTYNPG